LAPGTKELGFKRGLVLDRTKVISTGADEGPCFRVFKEKSKCRRRKKETKEREK
jgi:hypothetical protein